MMSKPVTETETEFFPSRKTLAASGRDEVNKHALQRPSHSVSFRLGVGFFLAESVRWASSSWSSFDSVSCECVWLVLYDLILVFRL